MEEMIINFVKECPWLYDTSRQDYRDAEKKENSWRKLAQELNIPEKIVKEKWKNLRSSFTREKRTNPSGCVGGKKKPWIFMDLMSFLHPYVKERRITYSSFLDSTSKNAEEDSESLTDSQDFTDDFCKREVIDESYVEQPSTSETQDQTLQVTVQPEMSEYYTKNKKRKLSYEKLCKSLEVTDEALSKLDYVEVEDNSDDEDEIFAKLVKKKLKAIQCPKQKINIQIKILQVMKSEIDND